MWGTRCGILLVWKILKETGLLVCSCSQKKDLSIKETRGEIFIGPIVIFFQYMLNILSMFGLLPRRQNMTLYVLVIGGSVLSRS